jgi:hypothetical protein
VASDEEVRLLVHLAAFLGELLHRLAKALKLRLPVGHKRGVQLLDQGLDRRGRPYERLVDDREILADPGEARESSMLPDLRHRQRAFDLRREWPAHLRGERRREHVRERGLA